HVPTWQAAQLRVLYDRTLPEKWYLKTGKASVSRVIDNQTHAEMRETLQSQKNRLIAYARRQLIVKAERHKQSSAEIEKLQSYLDPQALTIGFARRFAPYKRADLITRDMEMLAKLVGDIERPVQFVFAGKAHPADDNGKAILQKIFQMAQDDRFRGRVVFLEDYDINLGRHLVQGVDVWLNNPRRPLEASGTSGQKVVLNG